MAKAACKIACSTKRVYCELHAIQHTVMLTFSLPFVMTTSHILPFVPEGTGTDTVASERV